MKKTTKLMAMALSAMLVGTTVAYASTREPQDMNTSNTMVQEMNSVPSETILTQKAAEAVALAHAGFTADQVKGLHSEYDVDDGVKQYDIEFRSGDYEYDYEVLAESGQVFSWSKEYDDDQKPKAKTETKSEPKAEVQTEIKAEPKAEVKTETKAEPKAEVKTETKAETKAETHQETPAPVQQPQQLTNAQAEAKALAHAGLKADQVTRLHSKLDMDDGVKHYDVEFRSGNYEYDYEVHAESGTVLSWDKEYDDDYKSSSKQTEPKTESKPETQQLTNAQAEAKALAHAGLKADQVTRLKSEFDVDDGMKQYEIEFRSGKFEYEYTVNAETGEILSWDKEVDD